MNRRQKCHTYTFWLRQQICRWCLLIADTLASPDEVRPLNTAKMNTAIMNAALQTSLVVLLLVLTPLASFAQQDIRDTMKQYRWKNRVVLIFADDPATAAVENLQASIVADAAGFEDRHLVLMRVFAGGSTIDQKPIPPQTAAQLQAEYNADAAAFRVVLVGKDGGVKLDRTQATSLQDIFGLIDTMPMRRQEMRQQETRKQRESRKGG